MKAELPDPTGPLCDPLTPAERAKLERTWNHIDVLVAAAVAAVATGSFFIWVALWIATGAKP